MEEALQVFLAENPEIGDRRRLHTAPGGWYSIDVLATALKTVAMSKLGRISWELDLIPVRTASELAACQAVIQHQPALKPTNTALSTLYTVYSINPKP